MHYRDIQNSDLQHVGPMYKAMLRESRSRPGSCPYPAIVDLEKETEDFTFQMMKMIRQGFPWRGLVAVVGGVTKGFLLATIMERIVGQPRRYAMAEVFYIDPVFRGGDVGVKLVSIMRDWALENGAQAFEACYVPGSSSHKIWARAGIKSYMAFGVLSDENYNPLLGDVEYRAAKQAVNEEVAEG